MEEKKKRFTSLPSNYVTLQELQERRVKEQEQRQKEKREEEQRREFLEEQRLKEEQEMRREQEQEERELLETQKAQAIEAKTSGRSNRGKKLRNLSERNLGIWIGPDMQKGGGGGGGCVAFGISADGGISDEGQKPEEPKHEKKKKKWNKYSKKKTMKPTTEEGTGAGVLDHSQAENGHDGNQIPVESKKDNKRVRKEEWEPKVKKEEAPTHRIRGGTRRGSKSTADEQAARASGVKMEKDNLTVTVMETARELEDLAVSDQHNQKEENRGGSMAVRAGSGNYCGGPKLRKQQWFGDGSLMWVRKGETSDGSGIQKAEAKPKPCVS